MELMSFLTIVVYAFALVMLLAGIFSAFFGSGKSRYAGGVMALIGLVIGVVWTYLGAYCDAVTAIYDVPLWDVVYNAIVNLIGVLVGALIAVGIFLVVVLKS